MEPENMKWALDPGLALFTCPIVSNKVSQPVKATERENSGFIIIRKGGSET